MNTLRTMQNFSVFLRNAGRLDEAEPLQCEALARFMLIVGEDGLGTASARSATGTLLKLMGDLAGAEKHLRKALVIREEKLGSDDKSTMLVRNRLNDLLAGA